MTAGGGSRSATTTSRRVRRPSVTVQHCRRAVPTRVLPSGAIVPPMDGSESSREGSPRADDATETGDGGDGDASEDGEGDLRDVAADARVSSALDLRAAVVRSAGYAFVAAAVALGIHVAGTARGLGGPGVAGALALDVGRSTGAFAVAYPIVLALNTAGRRFGATRAVAARTASPTRLYLAVTVLVTVALFLPVIAAILDGRPY